MSNKKWDGTVNGIEDAPDDFINKFTDLMLKEHPEKKEFILERKKMMQEGYREIFKKNKKKYQ